MRRGLPRRPWCDGIGVRVWVSDVQYSSPEAVASSPMRRSTRSRCSSRCRL
jgi:hypothetical protein